MSTVRSFPDLIADRAAAAAAPGTDPQAIRAAVLAAFGCSCPTAIAGAPVPHQRAGEQPCLVHSSRIPRRRPTPGTTLPSQIEDWENDPYRDHSEAERREDVQATLRDAAELGRGLLHHDLDETARRAPLARERLAQSLQHAAENGGLTEDELRAAEDGYSALTYGLRLLYFASNHVGDSTGGR
ncbi:hypothetical protein [Actinoplanes sp. G11-F43]|uniref:hypothetical protein n=1 Tax=Actinoplanes sp. G11-F43 TaxID=3424130 RepID=UPI003D32B7A4